MKCIKIVSIMIIVLGVAFVQGCSSRPKIEPVREKMIELSMPEEEGIFIEKIGDGSMILVKVNTDYGFKDYLKEGSDSLEDHMEYLKASGFDFYENALTIKSPFCTTYSAQNASGEFLFGRNDDYLPEDTGLLIYTKPKDGYASVSMTNGGHFGYINEDTNVEEIKKYMRAAVYFPADGMNECGVAIAQNLATAKSDINPNKVSIGSAQALRMVLDYAKNVDEAIALLTDYNIYFELDLQCHYLISDATGKSVVVEFVDGKMNVIESNYPWQVNTNFVLSNFKTEKDATFGSGCSRYKAAYKDLKKKNGILKENEPFELLSKVVQGNTLYSTVYNKTSGDIQVAMRRKFSRIYQFHLEMKE